jgi:ribonucleoside-diphosphate reductase alpha chain
VELSENARITYEKRYLKKDAEGNPLETPADLLRRVASSVAAVEQDYGKDETEIAKIEDDFFEAMSGAYFLPNSPTLMNAGRDLQQLSACFVLPVEDSMEGIFTSLKHMALVQKTGGGTGFSFDRLRPAGDRVRTTNGVASGPISFLKIFDAATEAVKQGGTRRGANMGTLRYDHPDIIHFICCKESEDEITNFNLSVTISDEFMRKVTGEDPDPMYPLINPRTGEPHTDPETGEIVMLNAREVFDLIVEKAWDKGDPGIIFIDQMNRFNPTPQIGAYETTNPCGEQPLLPYEACCLASLNLGRFVTDEAEVDWEKLRQVTWTAVRFLFNIADYGVEAAQREHYLRTGIVKLLGQLPPGVKGIAKNNDRPEAQGTVISDHKLRTVGQVQRHAAALADAEGCQHCGKALRLQIQLPVSKAAAHEPRSDDIGEALHRFRHILRDRFGLNLQIVRHPFFVMLQPDLFNHT